MKQVAPGFSKSAERPASIVLETLDGRAYCGRSLAEAVERMRAEAWGCPSRTAAEYRRRVAQRVLEWNKQVVRVGNVDDFIADLEGAGIVTVRLVN